MTNQPTTTERKPITQPLQPPEPLQPRDDRRARRPGMLPWAVLVVAIVLIAGGVFLYMRQPDPLADTRPVDVVKKFVAAIEARDVTAILQQVEPTIFRREISPEIRSYVENLQSVSFENASYTLIDNTGEKAHVHWTATMHYTIERDGAATSGDRAVDTTFELTKFESNWYLHSAVLPK